MILLKYLGEKWYEVEKYLRDSNIKFCSEVIYPCSNITTYGDLRVVRVNKIEEELKFILLHDKFNK